LVAFTLILRSPTSPEPVSGQTVGRVIVPAQVLRHRKLDRRRRWLTALRSVAAQRKDVSQHLSHGQVESAGTSCPMRVPW